MARAKAPPGGSDMSPLPLHPLTGKPTFDADGEMSCCNPGGHEYAYTGTAYGGDDESHFGEGRCYCIWCGADGDG